MQTALQTVLVLFGGRSAEHEISILSAQFIVASLDRSRFLPLLIGIDRDGRWRRQDEAYLSSLAPDADRAKLDDSGPLVTMAPMPTVGERAGRLFCLESDAVVANEDFDVVFPILHGPMGEDGTVQGLCELARVPYVGCGVAASAATMDKVLLKHVLAQSGIAIVPQQVVRRSDFVATPSDCVAACSALGFPLFAKPANMGSSLGISKVVDAASLPAAIEHALRYDDTVVVEKGLEQFREIEVSVLGNEAPLASIPGEICVHHSDGFYSYDAKYIDDGARLDIPAKLSGPQTAAAQQIAIDAFVALGCSGMARVDLFLSQEAGLFVNEINAIPGFTGISMFPQLLAASGIDASQLVSRLIALAHERHTRKAALETTR
jgi:D-alanine-D-alanine ligase